MSPINGGELRTSCCAILALLVECHWWLDQPALKRCVHVATAAATIRPTHTDTLPQQRVCVCVFLVSSVAVSTLVFQGPRQRRELLQLIGKLNNLLVCLCVLIQQQQQRCGIIGGKNSKVFSFFFHFSEFPFFSKVDLPGFPKRHGRTLAVGESEIEECNSWPSVCRRNGRRFD